MKKFAILMSVLMLVAFSSGMAFAKAKPAKVEAFSGEVVQVNAAAGTITIKAHKKDQTLKAEPKMLEGITVGEKVNIKKSGDVLKSIKAKSAPSAMATPKK